MYVKINGIEYPATINGKVQDSTWGGRASKSITLEMDYADAINLFVNNAPWYIVDRQLVPIVNEETGEPTDEVEVRVTEWDNSDYCIAGDIIDHRDGTITAKMGKLTDLEEAYSLMFGEG